MKKHYFVIFFSAILIISSWLYLNTKSTYKINTNILINYPEIDKLNFSWEKVDFNWKYYYNKERFDKEFLITSNNYYQLFLYIKRYPLYIPYIEKKLAENDIPDDFKYLAIAESALLNNTLSSASAAGIWQFMPETAKRYDLIVNDVVDERYNFEKSTDAAIAYFKDLYKKFWNRTLVAAAYNRWENWLQRALDKQNVSSYYDLYINEETSRYVFRILSIKYALEDYKTNNKIVEKLIWWEYKQPEIKTIKVFKIENLLKWSEGYNQNFKSIKLLNQWIIWDYLPKWEWEIKILKI